MDYAQILDYLEGLEGLVNTHSHLNCSTRRVETTLPGILNTCYTNWIVALGEDGPEARERLCSELACNTYFTWFARAMGELYGDGTPLQPGNWEALDGALQAAHRDPDYQWRVLSERCGYGTIVLDDYGQPGNDLGRPELIRPAYRCDAYLNGFAGGPGREMATDMLGGSMPQVLDAYLDAVAAQVEAAKTRGASCLKFAIAYDRDLDFRPTLAADRALATRGFGGEGFAEQGFAAPAIRAFQDLVLERILQTAAAQSLPVQIHTGLGLLDRTGARFLRNVIAANPSTTFMLFHGSYPWSDDVLGLLHVFPNVRVDLCWLPMISTRRAIDFLLECLEVGRTSDLVWGCDTCCCEESYGALLAARHVVATALVEAQQTHGLSDEMVRRIGAGILRDNALRILAL